MQVVHEQEVRFADVDLMGIVHNSIYLTYFESARVKFFVEHLGTKWDWQRMGLILAKSEVEYHKPITFPANVSTTCTCSRIGTTSFNLAYSVSVDGTLCASGSTVMVCYDHTKNSKIEIPSAMKDVLEKCL